MYWQKSSLGKLIGQCWPQDKWNVQTINTFAHLVIKRFWRRQSSREVRIKVEREKNHPTCPQGAIVRLLQVHQSGDEVRQHTPGIPKRLSSQSLQKMMQPVLPYQIYSRALEECYTEEEWAQEQCPTEREVFHNSLPSILLYREYPQYIIVCSSLHIYCADIWSLHICCVDCRYSRQQLPRWGRHPASAFWHFPPNFPPDFRRMSCRTSSPELAARAPKGSTRSNLIQQKTSSRNRKGI